MYKWVFLHHRTFSPAMQAYYCSWERQDFWTVNHIKLWNNWAILFDGAPNSNHYNVVQQLNATNFYCWSSSNFLLVWPSHILKEISLL